MISDLQKVIDTVREGFTDRPILVIGDCMIDRYIWGQVDRISPEAPVPVVRVEHDTATGGGAANVALNLAGLGVHAILCGLVGEDQAAADLRAILYEQGIDTEGLVEAADRPTTVKTRIMGSHRQMLRIDREEIRPIGTKDLGVLREKITTLMKQSPAVVILSDYNKGTLSAEICALAIASATAGKIPVLVDPKGADYTKYHGATAILPNRGELSQATAVAGDDLDALLAAGAKLKQELSLQAIVVKLGDLGVAFLDEEGSYRRIPAQAQDVFDVSGAGDTVVATFGASLAAGHTLADAAYLANLAGGIVVGKVGTAPVHSSELLAALTPKNAAHASEKIVSLDTLINQVKEWRDMHRTLVFTNGCFDLLHPGHVAYLEAARNLGDYLVVGLNTDESVRRLKGADRPVMLQDDRSNVLAALASVDRVVLFDDDTPLALINALKPDVLAKGADYQEHEVVGYEEVKSWGGEVRIIPLVEGSSTSLIIQRLVSGAKGAKA